MRYVVLDTAEEGAATEVAGHRGAVLDRFHTEASARALTLHRMASGDTGVVVIDTNTGEIVYPPPDEGTEDAEGEDEDAPVGSGERRRVTGVPGDPIPLVRKVGAGRRK